MENKSQYRECTEQSLGTLDNFIKMIRNNSVFEVLDSEVWFSGSNVNS